MIQGQHVHKQILKGIGGGVFSNIPNPVLVAAEGLRRERPAGSGQAQPLSLYSISCCRCGRQYTELGRPLSESVGHF